MTDLLDLSPYGLPADEKRALLWHELERLTRHHHAACEPYRHLVDRVFGGLDRALSGGLEGLPFVPGSLFKQHVLKSVPDDAVLKVLTSSGTTGQAPSRIYLDAETARRQATALVRVVQHHLGRERMPMVVVDHAGVVKDRTSFSARGAGILGMMQFGHRPFYALRDDLSLDLDGLRAYLAQAGDKPVLLFGFTFIVWEQLVRELARRGEKLSIPRGVLVHSGGWKKLQDQAVGDPEFRAAVREALGVERVLNFYGMVEQVGGVYFSNPLGHLHAPVYSDVVVRDPVTLQPVPDGTPGLVQVLSALPESYPGHSLLTEDLGVIEGVDHPDLAMKGRYFRILGRLPRAEVRGCSDTVTLVRPAA